jgi:Asp-tRNA(Asn)/Glu-tRNA(Gln) amidotransferase A subunit family amidase
MADLDLPAINRDTVTRALREIRLTAQELVEVAIAKHEHFDERLHAYSLWTPDRARESAKAADAALASSLAVTGMAPVYYLSEG